MLTRIEVAQKSPATDSRGNKVLTAIREDVGLAVDRVASLLVYTLEMELTPDEAHKAASELLADPVTEAAGIDQPLAHDFDYLIEVGFKPGVTDNIGRSSREGLADLWDRSLGEEDQVFTSRQYLLWGKLTREEAERIAVKLLANDLIERYRVISRAQWDAGERIPTESNGVHLAHEPRVETITLPDNDADLEKLSRDKILSLSLEEMRAIRTHYTEASHSQARAEAGLPQFPTDVELEVIAQTWSEHCKHKIFNADIDYTDAAGEKRNIRSLYKTYVKAATAKVAEKITWLKSVFTDNAGIIAFTEDYDIAMKVETHNSPSALDPYGGAMTGIVGVNRDIMGCGIGCKPLFNTDVFCFATPFYDKPVPPKLHHPKRVLKEVHRGVRDGGNESGIPTVNGSIVFDDRFLGKPLVFCGTGGLIPATVGGKPSHLKTILPGDRIVMAGGRIGKDGIHGATFSSAALTETSPTSAVQIGDPITQKKLSDFLLEARDLSLYRFVTDNGAGGLSSSLGEMARECGGCRMHLDRAPLKYPGLDPWEILVSEAQERMSFAVPPEKMEAFSALAKKRGVEVADLGEFSDDGLFAAYYDGKLVCRLEMEFLHDGAPRMRIPARLSPTNHREPEAARLRERDLRSDALQLLSTLNICSKESWVRQYDHEVQGMSVVKPFTGAENDGPSDAAVIRPLYHRKEGLAVAHGIVPRYSDIDCYHMAACAIDEAVRNAVAVGADPDYLAGLDNFCWPDPVESPETPDGAHKMAQLVRANEALYDYCTAYGLPLISGKDSMKNDYRAGSEKISIPPTLLVTVIGRLPDVEKSMTLDAKQVGDFVYALGITRDELGGSEYYAMLGEVGVNVPRVDAAEAMALYRALHKAILAGYVRSVHDMSDGGLFTALAETSMAGRLGMDIQLDTLPVTGELSPAALLFSESQSRFVVTVPAARQAEFEQTLSAGAKRPAFAAIGRVTEAHELRIALGDQKLLTLSHDEMFHHWHQPLNW